MRVKNERVLRLSVNKFPFAYPNRSFLSYSEEKLI